MRRERSERAKRTKHQNLRRAHKEREGRETHTARQAPRSERTPPPAPRASQDSCRHPTPTPCGDSPKGDHYDRIIGEASCLVRSGWQPPPGPPAPRMGTDPRLGQKGCRKFQARFSLEIPMKFTLLLLEIYFWTFFRGHGDAFRRPKWVEIH